MFWCNAADSHFGSFVVVCPEPRGRGLPDIFDGFKNVLVEPVISDSPVVAFNIGNLLWFSALDKLQTDTACLCPGCQQFTDIFGSVVAPNIARNATPLNDLIQCPDHTGREQGKIDLDAQPFPVEIVNHIESPEAEPVPKLIVQEIHGPSVVYSCWHSKWFRLLPIQPFLRLDTQI